jgi:hypothetical protein
LSTLATKKECPECFVDAAQHILQNLTVNRTNVISNGFDVWELVRLPCAVDALAVRRPCLTTLLQGRVVQFSAHIERCLQFFSLPAIRIKTIFERSSGHCKATRMDRLEAVLSTALGLAHIEKNPSSRPRTIPLVLSSAPLLAAKQWWPLSLYSPFIRL